MLVALSIRDIVLIEKLNLTFEGDLTVLTGETGAGKSILLDALSLALGGRGDAALVRAGYGEGQVTAVFDLPGDHAARQILNDNGIDADGDLLLRRVQSVDGRSRAFVNDQPVSVGLQRSLGQMLVEIHGQHDERALVDAETHRELLDAFAGHDDLVKDVADAWGRWQELDRALDDARARLDTARREEEFLRHALEEIETLAPEPDEETALADARQRMMGAEKLAGEFDEAMRAVSGDDAADIRIAAILRRLERQPEPVQAMVAPVTDALAGALDALEGARLAIEVALRETAFEPGELERAEERLFALRALARKHNIAVDQLAAKADEMRAALLVIETGEGEVADLEKQVAAALDAYNAAAARLSKAREKAGLKLDKAINKELAPLKLEAATFTTQVEQDIAPGRHGIDTVAFWVQTNPGTRAGPLMKVASGGELSRILLALKVSLAERGSAPTLVFDEIDTAVGGAVSDAIGKRLKQLAENVQVISITHAPQVAARASHHFRIAKTHERAKNLTATDVAVLDSDQRKEEIARMLAGATITDEARAAAAQLMAHAG